MKKKKKTQGVAVRRWPLKKQFSGDGDAPITVVRNHPVTAIHKAS